MCKSFLVLMFLATFFSCSSNTEGSKNQVNQYDSRHNDTGKAMISKRDTSLETYSYDTILKGGYVISFSVDDTTERLYLKKNKIIKEIASCSRGLPYKNLGYKAADFDDYFVLAHSFGSGNPHYIELINKDNGQNILEDGAAWIGADDEKELLLYCKTGLPTTRDKMILYDVKRNQKGYFSFPDDIFNEPMVLGRISIDTIAEKELVIKYESQGGVMKKRFSRLLK